MKTKMKQLTILRFLNSISIYLYYYRQICKSDEKNRQYVVLKIIVLDPSAEKTQIAERFTMSQNKPGCLEPITSDIQINNSNCRW